MPKPITSALGQLSLTSALVFLTCFSALTVNAQSGRKAPPVKPAQPNAQSSETQDDQVVSDGRVAGNVEITEGDTIRVNTSLVTVPVSVMDRYGKYVPNMQRRDFHVFDNGVEQRIAYFATVDRPFTVVLLIDTSGSTHFKMDEIQDAAISFVRQLKDEDKVMVISFDDTIRVLTEPTNDRPALAAAIRRTRTGGGTRLYDAVDMVIRRKLSSISGRKAIVLFTDGVDTTSRQASYSSTIKEAEESEAPVYSVAYDTSRDLGPGTGGRFPGGRGGVILSIPFPGGGGRSGGPGGGGSGPGDYRRANEYLHEVADVSGGRYFRGDTIVGISGAFAEVADELRRQYSIGFYPLHAEAGQRHDIKVRVNQSDLVVKARDSYVYSSARSETK